MKLTDEGVMMALANAYHRTKGGAFPPPTREELAVESRDSLVAQVIALNILLNDRTNDASGLKLSNMIMNEQVNRAAKLLESPEDRS